jgi:TPR repeat protein
LQQWVNYTLIGAEAVPTGFNPMLDKRLFHGVSASKHLHRPAFVVLVCAIALLVPTPVVPIVPYQPPITAADVAARKVQAAAGDKNSQAALAYWYYHGAHGLPLSRQDAEYWYRKAAEQGDELSQRQLSAMYEFGEGVPANHDEALRWMRRALATYSGAAILIAHRYRIADRAPQDFGKAIEWCRLSADAGDIAAQNMLGELYETGAGVQNFAEAAKWYRIAAEAGPSWVTEEASAVAMANLAQLYASGKGVLQDYGEAVKWYRRAVEKGKFAGRYGLGLLYEQGLGVPRDLKKAMELYYEVAVINREARERLFALYEHGLGLPTEEANAIYWYREAAQQGDVRAQVGLGLRYKFGRGVERNWSVAYALFNLAARSTAPGFQDIPDFTGPEVTAELYMVPKTWSLVSEMAKPGNFLNALDRYDLIKE